MNVVALHLPPLRARPSDVPPLVDHLLERLCARHHRAPLALDAAARAALEAYEWPGNVRELLNALERAVVLARGDAIRLDDLPDRLAAPPADRPAAGTLSLEDLERRHVRQVLAESSTLEEAAARLGINLTTLWRKRKRWQLD